MTLLEGRLIGEEDSIEIEKLCRLCNLSLDIMTELLEHEMGRARGGRSVPAGQVPLAYLPRLRVAGRLIHDLGLNVSGAALAVELLEAQRDLERRVRELEGLIYSAD